MLKDEIAEMNTLVKAPGPAAKKRKRAATSANVENESIAATPDISDDTMDTSPSALLTRRAAAAAEEKALKEAEEAAKAAEPQFIVKLPAHLEKWDHNKCDRCRKIKAACDGTETCPNCIAGEAECTKKESRKTFSMKRADEIAKQKHKFDVVSTSRNYGEVEMSLISV